MTAKLIIYYVLNPVRYHLLLSNIAYYKNREKIIYKCKKHDEIAYI